MRAKDLLASPEATIIAAAIAATLAQTLTLI